MNFMSGEQQGPARDGEAAPTPFFLRVHAATKPTGERCCWDTAEAVRVVGSEVWVRCHLHALLMLLGSLLHWFFCWDGTGREHHPRPGPGVITAHIADYILLLLGSARLYSYKWSHYYSHITVFFSLSVCSPQYVLTLCALLTVLPLTMRPLSSLSPCVLSLSSLALCSHCLCHTGCVTLPSSLSCGSTGGRIAAVWYRQGWSQSTEAPVTSSLTT